MLYLKICGIALFLFIGVLMLGLGIDVKELFKDFQRSARRKAYIEESGGKDSTTAKLIEYTAALIAKSNIRIYVAYNVWIHFFVCIIFGFGAFLWIIKNLNPVLSLAFSLVVAVMPYIVLQVISDIFDKKEKKNAVNFLIILKNFFMSGKNDIFEAFENSSKHMSEPLKTYLELVTHEYRYKVNALACLDNLKKKLGTPELRLYIENLKICYIQGGNIVGLTDTTIQELSNLDEDNDKQDAEDTLLNYGLYILLVLNFALIRWMINGSYRNDILGSLWGQIVFILDMVISFYIVVMSLRKS